jgi:hypothetical protein
MNGNRAARAAVCIAWAAMCAGAAAQQPQDQEAPQAQPAESPALQAAVEEATARLKLTPEQEAQLKALRQRRNDALKAIRDRHAGDDSRRARRAMFKEAEPVIDNYQARVRTILDESQYAEWEKMRVEARERLKERYKAGGAPE